MDKDQLFQIALAFFQQQDLSDLTPEEAYRRFESILTAITAASNAGKPPQRVTF